ncbi:MAG: hypothetical protein ACE5KZ_07205, partial [Candidatus Scalinduaceae bacterium]
LRQLITVKPPLYGVRYDFVNILDKRFNITLWFHYCLCELITVMFLFKRCSQTTTFGKCLLAPLLWFW